MAFGNYSCFISEFGQMTGTRKRLYWFHIFGFNILFHKTAQHWTEPLASLAIFSYPHQTHVASKWAQTKPSNESNAQSRGTEFWSHPGVKPLGLLESFELLRVFSSLNLSHQRRLWKKPTSDFFRGSSELLESIIWNQARQILKYILDTSTPIETPLKPDHLQFDQCKHNIHSLGVRNHTYHLHLIFGWQPFMFPFTDNGSLMFWAVPTRRQMHTFKSQ